MVGSRLRALLVVVALTGGLTTPLPRVAADEAPEVTGSFSSPFTEPLINGVATDEKCADHYADGHSHEGETGHGAGHQLDCKPTAGSMALLSDGRVLYWNALEGTENVQNGIAFEYADVSINDQTRVLDLTGPSWSTPSPADGGANPDGYAIEPLIPGVSASSETHNDGALFCSDLTVLADGRILAAGGTAYYNEGIAELEGLRNARIFDPASGTWSQAASMAYGRWYPSMVTLGDGQVFIASGVQKLIKPLYPSHMTDSGRNVVQTETFNPLNGTWTYNGASADRSLPLFPRLHLLPNGDVFFNAAGQVYNPAGQAYDESLWHLAASYNPGTKTWKDLGVPGVGTLHPGFRGSSFSVMLPLRANGSGDYTSAEFLSAGGVMGTTPGGFVAVATSAITSVDTSAGNAISTRPTGDLNEARWYSSGVALPSGEVVVFSGASVDEVVAPGAGEPRNRAEIFDPATETWSPAAISQQLRSYHNTAMLLPTGQVLVGGHAPITTLYGAHQTLPGRTPNDGRDPSFEIYSPPYLFRGPRPVITDVSDVENGGLATVEFDVDADQILSVVLVRNSSVTHLVDGDQRTVVLDIESRAGNSVDVQVPGGDVLPPGPYMLFINRSTAAGPVPSVAASVFVG